jgi:hypothetical protein
VASVITGAMSSLKVDGHSVGQEISAFMEPECSLPFSQKSSIEEYPEPGKSSLDFHALILRVSI